MLHALTHTSLSRARCSARAAGRRGSVCSEPRWQWLPQLEMTAPAPAVSAPLPKRVHVERPVQRSVEPWLSVLDDQETPFTALQRAYLSDFLIKAVVLEGMAPRTFFVALRFLEHVCARRAEDAIWSFKALWVVCMEIAIEVEEDEGGWTPRTRHARRALTAPNRNACAYYVYQALEWRVQVRLTIVDELAIQLGAECSDAGLADAAMAVLPLMLARIQSMHRYPAMARQALFQAGRTRLCALLERKAREYAASVAADHNRECEQCEQEHVAARFTDLALVEHIAA